ncbi:hypothetical protein BHE74_00029871 [Ensete ventricosum]|uniref:Uncharacterized protein n=1 Tax=Ensete ventricosum TaxID=4639 RepID=A0A427A6J5_ENSVE|nr:hypothetical protein B296_00034727 [Ensete ventricosum]RWW33494.1 hypothetical protein GW17_00001799 [Ensete ventricosum]RWW62980.1 hypothetical protein BHE74_00029871 [Ensete ventricosum]RZS15441.1 hypothetical protein BHM03_00047287 [Ensete ventricosum]
MGLENGLKGNTLQQTSTMRMSLRKLQLHLKPAEGFQAPRQAARNPRECGRLRDPFRRRCANRTARAATEAKLEGVVRGVTLVGTRNVAGALRARTTKTYRHWPIRWAPQEESIFRSLSTNEKVLFEV